MKRLLAMMLMVSILFTMTSAFSLCNNNILTSETYTITEKLDYLEDKWNVRLFLNDAERIPTGADLQEFDIFLGKLTQSMNSISKKLVNGAVSIRSDGRFDKSWDTEIDEHVTQGQYGFYVRGTMRTTWFVNKSTVNGKVYLSGRVTNCRFLSGTSYSGTASFVGGSLNVQGNGTSCATTRPSADMSFEVVYDLLTVVFEHTFDTSYVELYLPN